MDAFLALYNTTSFSLNYLKRTFISFKGSVSGVQSSFVKFVCVGGGGEAAGRTPYTFYKPTLGPKYVSNRPYKEFITPTTIIWSVICIFNGFPLPIFDVGYTLDSEYAVTRRQCCDAIRNIATNVASMSTRTCRLS